MDLCAACGQPLRPAPAVCECGHPGDAHELTRNGRRTWCSYYTGAGACRCTTFQPAEE